MAKHGLVLDREAAALVETPVADQPRFGANQQGAGVALNFELGARGIPDAHFIDLAVEALGHCIFASADLQLIEGGVIVADRARTVVGIDQYAVGVGVDDAVVIAHCDVGPFIRLHEITGGMPAPVGIDIVESPHHLAGGGIDRHLVLAFLVDDDLGAGAQAGRPDPGLHGHIGRDIQPGVVADGDVVIDTVEYQADAVIAGLRRIVHRGDVDLHRIAVAQCTAITAVALVVGQYRQGIGVDTVDIGIGCVQQAGQGRVDVCDATADGQCVRTVGAGTDTGRT